MQSALNPANKFSTLIHNLNITKYTLHCIAIQVPNGEEVKKSGRTRANTEEANKRVKKVLKGELESWDDLSG